MRVSRVSCFFKTARRPSSVRGQRGAVMIELLIAIAIFGVISVSFLGALVAGYRSVVVAHDQTMAQSLTRTTFENVRSSLSAQQTGSDNVTTTSNYDVVVHAENVTSSFASVSGPSDIQKITVTIKYHATGRTLWQTTGIWVKPG